MDSKGEREREEQGRLTEKEAKYLVSVIDRSYICEEATHIYVHESRRGAVGKEEKDQLGLGEEDGGREED